MTARRRPASADWEKAKALYPATADDEAAWARVLAEQPDVMYSVIAYIVKVVKATDGPRKTGRRPGVTGLSFDDVLDVLYPERYTLEPLTLAVPKLMAGRTQRMIAPKVPCNQATLSRILSGQVQPDLALLRGLANALKVPPTYFVEYRAQRMAQLVQDALMAQPNVSVSIFKRLQNQPVT
jgi:transcriptional regulator with XRE-family HTH domain